MNTLRKTFSLAALALALAFSQATAQTCPEKPAARSPDTVTLRAVGDIALGTDWPKSFYPPDFDRVALERLRRALGEADVIFGNLEGALTTHNVSTKVPRAGAVYAIRMPPRFGALFREAGFDLLNISNNHTFDFGDTGLRDTLAQLSANRILAVGERDRVLYQTAKGMTLAWVGFSYLPRHNDMHDTEALAQQMAEARSRADLVIVSLQAGAEGSDALRVVNQEERFLGENRGNVFAFARRAVDLGADLVIGHGPHVLRGMECYRGKLILYSLGNFVGYGILSAKRAAALSIVAEVSFSRDRSLAGFDILPLRFDEDRFPRPDPDQLARHLINDLSALPPLAGNVRLSVPEETAAAYRAWVEEAGLRKALSPAQRRP